MGHAKTKIHIKPIFKAMRNTIPGLIVVFLFASSLLVAQKKNDFEVKSPDGTISVRIEAAAKLEWSVQDKGEQIIAPSAISLQLDGGEVLGDDAKITSSNTEKTNSVITAINYIKASIPDDYSQLTINCKNGFGVIFRVYNDAVAYRFFTKKKGEIIEKMKKPILISPMITRHSFHICGITGGVKSSIHLLKPSTERSIFPGF